MSVSSQSDISSISRQSKFAGNCSIWRNTISDQKGLVPTTTLTEFPPMMAEDHFMTEPTNLLMCQVGMNSTGTSSNCPKLTKKSSICCSMKD